MRKVLLLLVLLVTVSGCKKEEEKRLTYSDLKDVKKLVVAEMTIGKLGRIDEDHWYTVGKRVGVYSYDTYVRAFINMEELKYDDVIIDEKRKFCTITLPPVHVQPLGRDLTMTQEHMRVERMRSAITSQDVAALKEKMNKDVMKELEDNGLFYNKLIEAGETKARSYFSYLLKSLGYDSEVRIRKE